MLTTVKYPNYNTFFALLLEKKWGLESFINKIYYILMIVEICIKSLKH
jgi:hypothetical protein